MAKIRQDQQGMIIVFTLILLSVLLSAALGLSYFVIGDINKARAIDNSIIAYYAADAGLEQSLYLLKKQQAAPNMATLKELKPAPEALSASQGQWDILDSTDYEKTFLRQRLLNATAPVLSAKSCRRPA
jgi:hypothetical protein